MKRLVAVLVAAVLAASVAAVVGSGGAQAAPQAKALVPAFGWSDCGGGVECGSFQVPLDWSNPGGTKITLAVTRRVHTGATYRGVMLVNPGGPGAPGTGLADLGRYVPGGAGNEFDWIGFDPRGVGSSTPSLHCNSRYFGVNRPTFVPRTSRLMRYWLAKTGQYAAQCGASAARALLPHVATIDTVKDMEAIRAAYAAETPGTGTKLNFYGFSYGTYLAQVYATLYPSQVGRFVLDGVVDPVRYWYASNLQQEVLFDRNLNRYFQWLARHPRAYRLGTDWRAIRRGFNALLVKLDRHPSARGRLGPDELIDAMLPAAYYVFDWDGIGRAYSVLKRTGKGGAMFAMYAGANMGDDNGYAMYLATQCTDVLRPGWPVQRRDAWRIHRSFPFLAWDNTWYNAPCLRWRAPSHARIGITGAHVTSKILMINETYDAATSFSGALVARSRFPTASLIEGYKGTTHAGSLNGVACVDNRIGIYLRTGVVPARQAGTRSDIRCPRVPPPPATGLRTTGGGLPASIRAILTAAQLRG
ncbi:MAG: alpha/beta fold hydrolase [Nocardioidaceae bacterium]|nr:alpha/beta fold hydrolase [Nocardioidaceae bacterium]